MNRKTLLTLLAILFLLFFFCFAMFPPSPAEGESIEAAVRADRAVFATESAPRTPITIKEQLSQEKSDMRDYRAYVVWKAEQDAILAEQEVARAAEAARVAAREAESARVVAQPTPTYVAPQAASPDYSQLCWSAEQVYSTILSIASSRGLTPDQQVWIATTGTRIAGRESTYDTHAVNGQHLGLFQFNDDWGRAEDRLDGYTACQMFVNNYVQQGERGIRNHWAATF